MHNFLVPLIAVVAVQICATAAAYLLRFREAAIKRHLPSIVSLAVGVLMATSLLHLMPEAVDRLGNRRVVWFLLGGTMLLLFACERLFFVLTGTGAEPEINAPHEHQHVHHGAHSSRPVNLIASSMLHSLVDGAAITVAFLTDARVGWVTAFAVALHEIPHRMGDFALLIHLRVPVERAVRLIVIAGVPSLLGLALVLAAGGHSSGLLARLLPVSAGSFLYIASVNLLPELQTECRLSRVVQQLGWLGAGVALVAVLGSAG